MERAEQIDPPLRTRELARMNEILTELLKNSPIAAAMIIVVWLFLDANKKQELTRIENAKALENKRETHEKEMNTMWGRVIKQMMQKNDINSEAIMTRLEDHEKAMHERYDKFQITKDLLDAAKEIITKQDKK